MNDPYPIIPASRRPQRLSATLIDLVGVVPEWMGEAICAQVDPDAFYPEAGTTPHITVKVCLGCPVRRQCLAYALDNDERWGIWGGLTASERQRIKKKAA